MRLRSFALALATLALLPLAFVSRAQTPPTPLITIPLWPHATPEPPQTTEPEADITKPTDNPISGHRTARLTNVTVPTLAVYPPHDHSNGTAALVFPGGGYHILAWDGEGLDPCHWLNSLGMTCLLVKYRVPQPDGLAGHYPADPSDLEDAQQAMRLARTHASDWHINPSRIGVMGFSAGANLAVLLSTHPDDQHVESTPAAPDVDTHMDARANFAIIVYPAYLAVPPEQVALDPVYAPNQFTPPTFLIQAENDKGYGKNALVYYRALMDANVPAELHYFASGGHGFGMNPVGAPEEHWPKLAANWLRSISVLPPQPHHPPSGPSTGESLPCPLPQPPTPSRPTNASSVTSTTASASPTEPNPNSTPNPNCW
jgi:acetyl esterase/lipase